MELEAYKPAIEKLAREFGVTKIRVFGSFARGEQTAESDIDFLVVFEKGRSYLDLINFTDKLKTLLGREVDVVTENSVSKFLKDVIFKEARPL